MFNFRNITRLLTYRKKLILFFVNIIFLYYGFRVLTYTTVKMEKDIEKSQQHHHHHKQELPNNHLKDRIKYIIKNEHFCEKSTNLKYIIYVHTAPDHKLQRHNLRKTWANKDLFLDHRTNVVFLMGSPEKNKIQQEIYKESELHGDIIQGEFIDSYRNLTLKGILGLQWLNSYCRNIEFAIKSDDDAFINIFRLVDILEEHKQKKKLVICPAWGNHTMHVMRDPKVCDKWCVKDSELSKRVYYPPYCSGISFTLSPDLIPEMYKVSFKTPFFWIDDVYITGLLLEKIPGVQFHNMMTKFRADENAAWDIIQDMSVPLKYYYSHVRKSDNYPKFWKNALQRLSEEEIKQLHPLVYSTLPGMP